MSLDKSGQALDQSRASPSSATAESDHEDNTTKTLINHGTHIMGGEPAGRLSDSDAAAVLSPRPSHPASTVQP